MKFMVKSLRYKDAEYVCNLMIKGKEYVRVRFSNYSEYRHFNGGKIYNEVDIPKRDVIKIYRRKTKIERYFIELIKTFRPIKV